MSFFFFFKKKTAYEVRISDWSSDVCSSDLAWLTLFDDADAYCPTGRQLKAWLFGGDEIGTDKALFDLGDYKGQIVSDLFGKEQYFADSDAFWAAQNVVIEARCEDYLDAGRSEEHTSELQSLMRISYAVFCLKKKHTTTQKQHK